MSHSRLREFALPIIVTGRIPDAQFLIREFDSKVAESCDSWGIEVKPGPVRPLERPAQVLKQDRPIRYKQIENTRGNGTYKVKVAWGMARLTHPYGPVFSFFPGILG